MQIYRRRYEKRRKAVFIGFSIFAALLQGVIFYTSRVFQPIWLLFVFMPVAVILMQRRAPLCFNRAGVAWTYALCEEKSLPRVGFIYWQDIESLTWLPSKTETGGSVEIQFHRGALQQHIPKEDAPIPEKQHGELIRILLLLYWLDADSEQVFQQMQRLWQQAHSKTTVNLDNA